MAPVATYGGFGRSRRALEAPAWGLIDSLTAADDGLAVGTVTPQGSRLALAVAYRAVALWTIAAAPSDGLFCRIPAKGSRNHHCWEA